MNEDFTNVYEDQLRSEAYSKLEFPGTYYLAFRDLPEIIEKHVRGTSALDFGCGTGRSTRFVRDLGYGVIGADISANMLELAIKQDPAGEYRLVEDGNLASLNDSTFDLIFCAFTFDNIPTMDKKINVLSSLRGLLRSNGRIVNVVSSPAIYVNEWASFSTKDFPENQNALSGDVVKIVMLDVADRRPVEDVIWTNDDYLECYQQSGLGMIQTYRPLGRPAEPFKWVNETSIAPWVIYVLGA